MLNILLRFLIAVIIITVIVELVVYWAVTVYGASFFIFLFAIVAIVVAFMVNVWYWLP
jgi:hypothetical protein